MNKKILTLGLMLMAGLGVTAQVNLVNPKPQEVTTQSALFDVPAQWQVNAEKKHLAGYIYEALTTAAPKVVKKADFSEVDVILEGAKTLKKNDYTADSWAALESVLDKIAEKRKLSHTDTSVTDADAAALKTELEAALSALVGLADYSMHDEIIAGFSATYKEGYTDESVARVEAAIARIDELKAKTSTTSNEDSAGWSAPVVKENSMLSHSASSSGSSNVWPAAVRRTLVKGRSPPITSTELVTVRLGSVSSWVTYSLPLSHLLPVVLRTVLPS